MGGNVTPVATDGWVPGKTETVPEQSNSPPAEKEHIPPPGAAITCWLVEADPLRPFPGSASVPGAWRWWVRGGPLWVIGDGAEEDEGIEVPGPPSCAMGS